MDHETPDVVQARKEERTKAILDAHTEDIKELRVGAASTSRAVTDIKEEVREIRRVIAEQSSAAAATARSAAEAASKAISSRNFVLGVLAILATLIASIIANGHL